MDVRVVRGKIVARLLKQHRAQFRTGEEADVVARRPYPGGLLVRPGLSLGVDDLSMDS
jgi:hypothetical protein